ncbi:MAG: glycine cleavage system aminomethyltransferase GcvT [Planctomycetia bacterium]
MRSTPLTPAHVEAGARMVDFHGWNMPVQYEGILGETRRVRSQVGLFDLCHMGRLEVRGKDREALVERVFSASLGRLKVGRAKYGFLLDERGYPIDDVLVYRGTDVVHIVINAGGRDDDGPWVTARGAEEGYDADVKDLSDEQAMIALQGPASEMTLQPLCSVDLSGVKYYGFANGLVLGIPCLLARTGYTGEDGFELFFDKAHARRVWDALLDSGRKLGAAPIGLGARDLLRLEAGMPLYGNEISREIHPLEADLEFGLDLSKTGTVGIPALARLKAQGFPRRAVSLAAKGGPLARTGTTLWQGSRQVGVVTSGGVSPTIERTISRALVEAGCAAPGTAIEADVRGKRYPFEVVPSPFYRRAR